MQNYAPHGLGHFMWGQPSILVTAYLHFGHYYYSPLPNKSRSLFSSASWFCLRLKAEQLIPSWPSLVFTWQAKQHFLLHSVLGHFPIVKFLSGNYTAWLHAGQFFKFLSVIWAKLMFSLVSSMFCSDVMRRWSFIPSICCKHPWGHSILVFPFLSSASKCCPKQYLQEKLSHAST